MPYTISNDSDAPYIQVSFEGELGHEWNSAIMRELASLPPSDTKALLMTFIDFEMSDLGAVDPRSRAAVGQVDCFDRVAVVADADTEKAVATIIQPFAEADVQFFDHTCADQAIAWLSS